MTNAHSGCNWNLLDRFLGGVTPQEAIAGKSEGEIRADLEGYCRDYEAANGGEAPFTPGEMDEIVADLVRLAEGM